MGASEVAAKFRKPGIADLVLAICRYQDKKLESLAIALGLGRTRDWKTQLENEMDRLIEECELPIKKHLWGLNKDGTRKQGSYVVYGLRRDSGEPSVPVNQGSGIKVTTDPGLATWSQQAHDLTRRQHRESLMAIEEPRSTELEERFREPEVDAMPRKQRTKAELRQTFEEVIAAVPTWPPEQLKLTCILEAGGFSSALFANRPDWRERAKQAIAAAKGNATEPAAPGGAGLTSLKEQTAALRGQLQARLTGLDRQMERLQAQQTELKGEINQCDRVLEMLETSP